MKTILLFLAASSFAFGAAPTPTPTPTPAPTPTDHQALSKIYPQLAPVRDYKLSTAGALTTWVTKDKRFPQPTSDQMSAAKATITAAAAGVLNVRAALGIAYANLPSGERALYRPVVTAVEIKLAVGDLAGAKDLINTAPTPTTTLQAARTAMLASFPQ